MLKCEKCIHKKICIDGANYKNAETCRNFVNEKDFAPVKHGHWEEIRDAYGQLEGWICKKCGRETKAKENYCPNCGAKMDGGDENG